jgi:F-type H+-transporting ATPase subunit delta
VMQNKEIQKLLANPFLDAGFWTGLLSACLKEAVDPGFASFVKVLHRNRRLLVIPAIQTLFHQYKLAKQGCLAMTIRSAEPISPEQQVKLKGALEQKYQHPLELQYEVQPSLIGGLQLVMGDQILDGSLQKRFERMRDTLMVST